MADGKTGHHGCVCGDDKFLAPALHQNIRHDILHIVLPCKATAGLGLTGANFLQGTHEPLHGNLFCLRDIGKAVFRQLIQIISCDLLGKGRGVFLLQLNEQTLLQISCPHTGGLQGLKLHQNSCGSGFFHRIFFHHHFDGILFQIAAFGSTLRQKPQDCLMSCRNFLYIYLKKEKFAQTLPFFSAEGIRFALLFLLLMLHAVKAAVLLIRLLKPFQLLQQLCIFLLHGLLFLIPFHKGVLLRKFSDIFGKGHGIHLQNLHRLLHFL